MWGTRAEGCTAAGIKVVGAVRRAEAKGYSAAVREAVEPALKAEAGNCATSDLAGRAWWWAGAVFR